MDATGSIPVESIVSESFALFLFFELDGCLRGSRHVLFHYCFSSSFIDPATDKILFEFFV